MAMFGGLVLAVALSPPLLVLLGLSFMRFWDAAAVTMLVGMIFTRVGCLLHGCCSGRPTMSRFGLRVSDADGHVERRVPTQLLEAISASLILAGAIVVSRRVAFPGSVFLFSLGGYGLARLVLDQTRAERVGRRGPTVAQALSAACVMVALSASAAHLV
jgi:phosphatidylglycerol:prolipoprotein diacylglycerol transferase